MIEIVIDSRALESALEEVNGCEAKLRLAVKKAIPVVAAQVRREVIGYLGENVALAPQHGALIKRAVKALQNRDGESRFRIASKRLLLSDYDVSPREATARAGVPVRQRKAFHYHLRVGGERYSSLSALTGRLGNGSIPFIARTLSGELRVMYRSANKPSDEPLLVYAPTVQYHAVTPEIEERAHDISMEFFRAALRKAISEGGA